MAMTATKVAAAAFSRLPWLRPREPGGRVAMGAASSSTIFVIGWRDWRIQWRR